MKRKPPMLDKPIRKHRPLREDEKELWQVEMGEKNASSSAVIEKSEKREAESIVIAHDRSSGTHTESRKRQKAAAISTIASHLDKPTLAKLRSDGSAIKARLDLHGHTRATAYSALLRFIETAQANGVGLAVIITGKGRLSGGALRELLPRWLEESPFRERIIAYDVANPRHGGEGAWYVRIRKSKTR